jgi:PadR family transcriptional regulator PadR
MNVQFKKGVLELCVLAMLDEKDCYGYELVSKISVDIRISEGTIYPLLKRLKEEGFLKTYLKESSEGAPRKYYQITSAGKKTKNSLVDEWKVFSIGVSKIISGVYLNE